MPTLIDGSQQCPQCPTIAASDDIEIIFGFRVMNGVTRPQSYCRACRSRQSSIARQRATANPSPVSPVSPVVAPTLNSFGFTSVVEAARPVSQPTRTRRPRQAPTTYVALTHINAIGVELEGGFTRPLPVNCIHTHTGVNCYGALRCTHRCTPATCSQSCEHQSCCNQCVHAHNTDCYLCNHVHDDACNQRSLSCAHNCRTASGNTPGALPWERYYRACQGNAHGDGTITGVTGTRWEVCSRPLNSIESIRQYAKNYAPDSVSSSCGTHFHVSLVEESHYDLLMEYRYYTDYFMPAVQVLLATMTGSNHTRLSGRIVGQGYNAPNHPDDAQAQANRYGDRRRHINYCREQSRREFGMPTIEVRLFQAMTQRDANLIATCANLIVSTMQTYIDVRQSEISAQLDPVLAD